jgi:catechol 2,3-dioxygenase-like lactoylglutathione lyase family enzyme
MPTLEGVLETSLYVEDLERSAGFYQALFGFEVVDSGERLIALRVADRQLLLLFKKRSSAKLPQGPHDGQGQLHLAFAIPAAELKQWEARLGQQGVVIEQRRDWPRGGHSLYFRDPDGHLLELATPGVWSVY